MAEYLCEADMSTGEYISRDLALRQLNATCLATDCDNYNGVRCRACAYADAMDFIDAIPAADVQPEKISKWCPPLMGQGKCDTYCERCHGKIMRNSTGIFEKTPFCPHCGARMDLKDGDTE